MIEIALFKKKVKMRVILTNFTKKKIRENAKKQNKNVLPIDSFILPKIISKNIREISRLSFWHSPFSSEFVQPTKLASIFLPLWLIPDIFTKKDCRFFCFWQDFVINLFSTSILTFCPQRKDYTE